MLAAVESVFAGHELVFAPAFDLLDAVVGYLLVDELEDGGLVAGRGGGLASAVVFDGC